jgi:hypothetical protein
MNPQHVKQCLVDYALEFAHFMLEKSNNFVPFSAIADADGRVTKLGGLTGRHPANAKDMAAFVMKSLWAHMGEEPGSTGVLVYNGSAMENGQKIDAIFMIFVLEDGTTEKTYHRYDLKSRVDA